MSKKTVFLTGASGNMGYAGFKEIYKRKNKKKKKTIFMTSGRKNATKTDFMVISEQMIMNIIHSGRNRRKMLMRNRIEAVILI
mgnify:CR=1 FL=1